MSPIDGPGDPDESNRMLLMLQSLPALAVMTARPHEPFAREGRGWKLRIEDRRTLWWLVSRRLRLRIMTYETPILTKVSEVSLALMSCMTTR
jgi:hypothetical protein